MARVRLRDLGIQIGTMQPGANNAITDVPGVWVGHVTLDYDQPRVARTGVTVVVPREGEIWKDAACAGYHAFNGNGEMTGMAWVQESGLLDSPIAITNSNQVGLVRDTLIEYAQSRYGESVLSLPVVAETLDDWLNDIYAFHLKREHVFEAMAAAQPGPVAEGNVGGGTGMICHDFKGGIGSSSRVVELGGERYAVGALVQANYGTRPQLRVDGVPVGREIPKERVPVPERQVPPGGSIIVIIATDAPLLPIQCHRLAQRATVGLARVGGVGQNGSGDLFLAFSTGNHVPSGAGNLVEMKMIPHSRLNPFFEAVAEAVEESILNALTAAETVTGFKERTVYALPLDQLQSIVKQYGRA